MDNKKQQETLLYVWSLKERAEELLVKASNWEVKPSISKKVKRIDNRSKFLGQIIKLSLKPELTKKDKKQLINFTKARLNSLKKHFLSVHNILQENPNIIWDKRIEATEKELEERLTLYEKVVPLLFQKKE